MAIPANASAIDERCAQAAAAFGALIRSRRKAMRMRQDQLALASGVGRRFLIELEAGKPTCQIGRCLLVAEALGLRLCDLLGRGAPAAAAAIAPGMPDLPDIPDLPDLAALPELPDELGAVE
jgi:transcriptional regulator with XRE-family HTH domain